ncbi:MAG: hypothetical protein GY859_01985, partial [Desulfobacterales bacterium]|nr:hypothetical protein [Desulfobacterales bacterium]
AIENAAGADVIVEIYDGNGFVTWTAAADGEFEFTDLAPDGEYFLKFTSYEGDVETKVQWASASGAPDHDIGTPDSPDGSTPAAAKGYAAGGPPVHFRFSDAAAAANRRGGARPGMVSFLDSTTHVAHSTPGDGKRGWTEVSSTSHAGAVSNNPRVTVNWSPTAQGADEGYYYTFNPDPDHVITKRNAPGTRPGRSWTTTSNELTGDDVLYYFHIAAVDDRGRIGQTASRGYRIDTVAPSNGSVIGPETTTGPNITLFLGATPGVKEANISNIGYGVGAAWETRTKTRAWRLSDGEGEKKVYVQYRDLAGNTANYMMSTSWDPAGPGGFSLPDQTFAIAENSPAGAPVCVLLASGLDPALPLEYTLMEGVANHAFALDAATGEITVNDASLLDYETASVYILPIRVANGENTDEAYITINITDVDDGGLTLHDQTFDLPENSANGVIVGTVVASGPAPVAYEILSGNEDGAFAINPAGGRITLVDAGALDYDATPVYTLRVLASAGATSAEAEVVINIIEVDQGGLAMDAMTLHLSESAETGDVVGTITASGQGPFTFEILSGNMNDVFAMDPSTGEITVNDAGQLSYDATPVYILRVRATDGEETAEAYITVNIFETAGSWTAQWQNPRPAGNTLTSVWVYAPGSFYAAGEHGTIIHYDGAAWTAMDAGTSAHLHDIGGRPGESGGPELYAAGEAGLILSFNGESWTAMDSGVAENLNGLWAAPDEPDVFMVGDSGTILHHDGVEWIAMDSNTDQDLYDIVGYSASDLFAVGAGGVILYYDGVEWAPMDGDVEEDLKGAWASDADVFAVGAGGSIFRYDGSSWTAMEAGTTEGLTDVWGSSETDVYAVGAYGLMFHYDGIGWSHAFSGAVGCLHGVSGSSAEDIYAVGRGGAVLRFDGESWTPVSGGVRDNLKDVWASDAAVYAVGGGYDHDAMQSYNTILRGDGSDWLGMDTASTDWLYGVTGVPGS